MKDAKTKMGISRVLLTLDKIDLDTQKKNVLLHLDEKYRDQMLLESFLACAAKQGGRIFFSSRYSSILWRFFRCHKFFDTIIIPRPHLADSYIQQGTKYSAITVLPTEALGYINYYDYMTRNHYFSLPIESSPCSSSDPLSRVKLFLAWGDKSRDTLVRLCPAKSIAFVTVGHPRYDSRIDEIPPRKIRAKSKLIVGISSRFDLINSYHLVSDQATLLRKIVNNEAAYKFSPVEDKEFLPSISERIYKDSQDLANLFKAVKACDDLKSIIFDFRPHPRENLYIWKALFKRNSFTNLQLSLDMDRESFGEWLESLDVIITSPSTTVYDALLAGVIPILSDAIVEERENLVPEAWDDSNKVNQYILRPKSIQDMRDVLLSIDKNPAAYLPRSPELWSCVDEEVDLSLSKNSVKNILGEIHRHYPAKSHKTSKILFLYVISLIIYSSGQLTNILLRLLKKDYSSSWFIPLFVALRARLKEK